MSRTALTARCPRCSTPLRRSRDPESSGVCDLHGPQYLPAISPEAAAAEQVRPGGKQRQRPAATPVIEVGSLRDGCHIAPACLECPLERCVFDQGHEGAVRVGRARQGQEVKPVEEPRVQVLNSKVLGEQCLKALATVRSGIERLDQQREEMVEEARRLIAVATLCEVGVPEELREMVRKKTGPKPKADRPTLPDGTFPCSTCGRTFITAAALGSHKQIHRGEP